MIASNSHNLLDPNHYHVTMVAMEDISPSPENDDIYGEVQDDEQMDRLVESISVRGLGDPILLTSDRYILSGHRRYHALKRLGYESAPCYISEISREGNTEFHLALAEYNPQRVKSVGSILKESLLHNNDPSDTFAAIEQYHEASCAVDVEFTEVPGIKSVKPLSSKKQQFLQAVQHVVQELREYWPLTVRQIHYNLLNEPPLTSTPKRSKFPDEHYRYKNDDRSYKALVDLLTPTRYLGHIPFESIDDPTRPEVTHRGWDSVDNFVENEIFDFLNGYHRNHQHGQPRHIEILGEKNTLMSILRRVANEYYVPLTLGRGFSGPAIWKKMAKRFQRSGKDSMTLIIVSDYDPEGLVLADDAIRSLRDLWEVPVDYHRVAVTREQIDELELSGDFNPAKVTSSRYTEFVHRTGGDATWECEALPPKYLEDQVKAAIEANMDMDVFSGVVERSRTLAVC